VSDLCLHIFITSALDDIRAGDEQEPIAVYFALRTEIEKDHEKQCLDSTDKTLLDSGLCRNHHPCNVPISLGAEGV